MDDDVIDLDISAIFWMGKCILKSLQLWFEMPVTIGLRRRIMQWFILLNSITHIVLNILHHILNKTENLVERSFLILLLVRQISVLQKVYTFRRYREQIAELFENATRNIHVPGTVQDAFNKYQRRCNKKPTLIIIFTTLLALQTIFYILTIIAMSLARGEKNLTSISKGAVVLPIWLPFDALEYPTARKIIIFLQLIGIQPYLVILIGYFSFYSSAVIFGLEMFIHLDDTLAILRKPLQRESTVDAETWRKLNVRVNKIIKYTIQHHVRSLK
jgi:hypothetical protein